MSHVIDYIVTKHSNDYLKHRKSTVTIRVQKGNEGTLKNVLEDLEAAVEEMKAKLLAVVK